MTEFQFSLPQNFTGRFVSDEAIALGERESLLLEAYVPGIELVCADSSHISSSPRFDVTVRHKEADDQKMIVDGRNITLYGKWNGKCSPDLYHLLGSIARQHYLKNNLFPVHAAGVGLDDLVLIAGHSGSGKTTVTLKLMEKAGMKLYSGNKTVVDFPGKEALRAVAGTKVITAKTADLKRPIQGVEYGDRTAFRLGDSQYAQSADIGSIVLVRLNDGVQEWKVLEPQSALHTLYPYFLDKVNADVVVGKDVFDGSISPETKKYLVERLSDSLQQIPVYSATGSLSFIVDNIARINK